MARSANLFFVPKRDAKSTVQKTRPPLKRMLHIHAALLEGKYPNATKLAAELEVSTRSVMRDIDFMRDQLELPIEYDAAKWGFYYTEEVGAFPSITISEGELFAMVVAEKALQQYRGTPFEKPLMSALEKISENLPETISLNLGDWDETISFRTSAEPILQLRTFEELSRATAKREQLRLHYRKPRSQTPEERLVDPYHLANVNGEWFLFAYDHLRKAIRTFVPARIVKIERTGKQFERNARFSIQRELQNSFGVHSGAEKIKVVIHFAPDVADYIREKKWHGSQKLVDLQDGGVELQLTLSSLPEVQRWVLSWGGSARAVEPKQLVEMVEEAGRKIAGAHGQRR